VLRGIDLELHSGTITVLMGANGAGKSTLVKVICGYHQADGGRMTLAGEPFEPKDASAAIAGGVMTVHQTVDDGIIPALDVANNLMLDHLARPGAQYFVRERELRKQAARVASSMGIDVNLKTMVADLAVADRQMIAIARAMARNPKVLILDEPTSSLSGAEADRLFRVLDRLREQGVAILYISHRMSDIRRIADRIVCMRDGKVSGLFEDAPLDYEGAVTAMLGRTMSEVAIAANEGSDTILEIEGLRFSRETNAFDLTARDGEIVAIVGLLGSGKSRLAEVIYGLSAPYAGTMQLDGAPYAPTTSREAVAKGVFLSPKDRGTNAVIPAFDIANNMTLPFLGSFSSAAFLSGARQKGRAREMIERIGVVCQSETDGIGTLSGGNQQKVMIARWLLEPSRVLLLDEPFQGVDIGARRDIGKHIRASAAGRTTLVFVAEVDEALEIADRIIVMADGTVTGEHMNEGINMAALVADISLAAGEGMTG
jgi:simple sugar transport system ATP-binding protein